MVVTLTSPRTCPAVSAPSPGVVRAGAGTGRSELVHQAVHHLAELVVDRGAGAGVEVPSDDDEISAIRSGIIVSKIQNLGRLLLSDRTV